MVGIFLLVIGIAGLFAGISIMLTSLKTRGWPAVPGRIIERSVGPATTTGASRPGGYFEPHVKYSYTALGKSLTGTRIGLTPSAWDADTAKKKLAELPDDVEVHYNPKDPGDAYLQPSSIGMAIIFLFAGGLCFLIGAGVTVSSFLSKG